MLWELCSGNGIEGSRWHFAERQVCTQTNYCDARVTLYHSLHIPFSTIIYTSNIKTQTTCLPAVQTMKKKKRNATLQRHTDENRECFLTKSRGGHRLAICSEKCGQPSGCGQTRCELREEHLYKPLTYVTNFLTRFWSRGTTDDGQEPRWLGRRKPEEGLGSLQGQVGRGWRGSGRAQMGAAGVSARLGAPSAWN